MISNNMFGIILGQIIYNLSAPFREVSSVMLKNNLKEQKRENEFVKWDSYGKLGYSIITMIIALFTGILFNINSYLPLICALIFMSIGLIISFIYNEPSNIVKETKQSVSVIKLLNNKLIFLLLFMNIFTVGIFVFLHEKATLLIQFVCEDGQVDIAKISLIVSAIVFGSRVCRVLANFAFPTIYKKINKKLRLIYGLCFFVIFSTLCFAIGANINTNIIVKLSLISIGLFIVISIRDIYATLERKIIINNIEENEQKQALVLTSIFMKCGKLCSSLFALFILGFTSLDNLYIYILVFTIAHICICLPLAKYLKHDKVLENNM